MKFLTQLATYTKWSVSKQLRRLILLKKALLLIPIMLLLTLSHGCGHRIFGGEQELFPIHNRPTPPNIEWHLKNDQMFLSVKDYEALRIYAIEMDGLVRVYEKQISIINGK